MRATFAGERQAGLGVLLGLVALIALLAASLGLTLSYRQELKDTRATLAQRCGNTEAFRTAVGEWHAATIAIEQSNPYVDDGLREKRVAASEKVIDAVNAANRRSCSSAYRSVR